MCLGMFQIKNKQNISAVVAAECHMTTEHKNLWPLKNNECMHDAPACNALYNLMNNCDHSYYNIYQFIVTLYILHLVIIIYNKI